MKHLFRLFIIITFLTIPVFAQEPQLEPEQTVYITASGEGQRYHLEECRTLRNSEKREMTIEEAKKRGYTPCRVCKPGE